MSRRGFTLIELLVVIGIVGVLGAILFPVLAKARETARKSTCAGNLQQIGVAFAMYLSDHDEFYPCNGDHMLWMGRRWRWPLQPYLAYTAQRDALDPSNPNLSRGAGSHILVCPSDATAPLAWDSTSYAYAAAFFHTPAQVNGMRTTDLYGTLTVPCVAQTAAAVRYPSHKALAAEWLSNHTTPAATWWEWGGARNYVFADGHVKYLPATALRPAVNGYPDINLTCDGIAGKDID